MSLSGPFDLRIPSLPDRFAEFLPAQPLTRFAPSPTGPLHLGHVVHALFVWGVARALNGRVLLRIEDHDRARCRPEFEEDIHHLLGWLGLRPDLPPRDCWTEPSEFRQSDCERHYVEALERLAGLTFACDCSRSAIISRSGHRAEGEEARYDGYCRTRNLAFSEGRSIRLRLPDANVKFCDLWAGPCEQLPFEQCGDLLLRDRSGHWTYQFCVTVDDLRQGISLVVRGADLLSSTGRQVLLREMLGGGPPPVFAHHPLLHDDSGSKLGKSRFSQGLGELRAAGASAADVLGQAAFRAGWLERERPVPLEELFAGFVVR